MLQLIVGVLVLLIFFGLAPAIFRWLFIANFLLVVAAFVVLFVLTILTGAFRGGPNSGMFADEAMYIIMAALGMPIIMATGIVCGIVYRVFLSSTHRPQ